MKKSHILYAFLAAITAISCNQNQPNSSNTHAAEDHSHHDNCYVAVSGADTVHLYYHKHDNHVAGTIDFKKSKALMVTLKENIEAIHFLLIITTN